MQKVLLFHITQADINRTKIFCRVEITNYVKMHINSDYTFYIFVIFSTFQDEI